MGDDTTGSPAALYEAGVGFIVDGVPVHPRGGAGYLSWSGSLGCESCAVSYAPTAPGSPWIVMRSTWRGGSATTYRGEGEQLTDAVADLESRRALGDAGRVRL